MSQEITKENVNALMVKIALNEGHKGTGHEHLKNLMICLQAFNADTLEKKLKVVAYFNKNASQYSQNIERWKNPTETQEVEVDAEAYNKYI